MTGMTTTRTILDPTGELRRAERERVARPASLDGLTVALLDISKPRGDVVLDRFEERLTAQGIAVQRYRKPTFAKPAPADLRHRIATECGAVIEALADGGSCASCSVHDISELELLGVPGVFIASDQFVDAAEVQAAALGFAEVARVFTPHPVQDRTDDELVVYADDVFDAVLDQLSGTA